MRASGPRVVLLTRRTALQGLVAQAGTQGQAAFAMKSRQAARARLSEEKQGTAVVGGPPSPRVQPRPRPAVARPPPTPQDDMAAYAAAHVAFQRSLDAVQRAVPPDWRRAHVDREEVDRFVFEPDDVVLVVGQDGLVPNVAKYLQGQLVVGVNPDPDHVDGVLCAHRPDQVAPILRWVERSDGAYAVVEHTMALAEREDGQRLLALNEIFVGHASHQSARYRLALEGATERHSSSGVIVTTGTGATGWARSICAQRGLPPELLPGPQDRALTFLVREPFPSVATQTTLDHGRVEPPHAIELVSEMGQGGVVFADGIERDRLEFVDGQTVRIRVAEERLRRVVAPPALRTGRAG